MFTKNNKVEENQLDPIGNAKALAFKKKKRITNPKLTFSFNDVSVFEKRINLTQRECFRTSLQGIIYSEVSNRQIYASKWKVSKHVTKQQQY